MAVDEPDDRKMDFAQAVLPILEELRPLLVDLRGIGVNVMDLRGGALDESTRSIVDALVHQYRVTLRLGLIVNETIDYLLGGDDQSLNINGER